MGQPSSNPPDTHDHDGEDGPRPPRRSRHQLRLPTEVTRMDAPDEPTAPPDAARTAPDGATTAAAAAAAVQGERPSTVGEVEVHLDTANAVSVPPLPLRTPPPDGPSGSMVVVRRRVRMVGHDDSATSSTPPPPSPSLEAARISSPPVPRLSDLPPDGLAGPPTDRADAPGSSLPPPVPSAPPPAISLDAEPGRMTLPMAEPAQKRPSNPPIPRAEDAVPKRPSTPPPARRPSNPPPPMTPAASVPPPAAPAAAPSPPVTVSTAPPAASPAPVAAPAPEPAVAAPAVAIPPLPSQRPPPLPQVAAAREESVLEIDRISAPPDDEGVDVSIDDAAAGEVHPALPAPPAMPALPSTTAATSVAKPGATVDPSLAMLDELAELSTETHEILDPEAIEHVETPPRGTSLPPPPPKDAPRPPTKTSLPPVTSKISGHVTVPDTRPKRRRMWWEEVFNEDYFRTMERLTPTQVQAEADWIEHALGVEAGASILDVGCGAGRQAVELARRRYEVMGVDLSVAMLTRAAEAAQEQKAAVAFTQCDMAAMEFDEGYDAAYCVGSSFGFFDDGRNAEVARRIHRALKPHGTFLLAVLNRDHTIQRQPAMAWFEGDGCVCMEESTFNFITSRLNVKRTMIFDDGRQREFEYSMRLYSLHELGQVLHEAGFRILEVSGSSRTPGAFFGPTSRELIILAQKRAHEVVDLAGDASDSSRPV